MSAVPSRHLLVPGTHNIRDLGGYRLPDGGETLWRRVLRGDSLVELSPEGRAMLINEGLSTVVDLRGPHETAFEASPFFGDEQIRYRNIPLFDALSPIEMSATPFDMAARYRDALDRCGARMAEVIRAIGEAPPGTVLIHCTAGKDRTGIVSALLLLLAGVEQDVIAQDYALTATLARPMLDRLRERGRARGATDAHLDLVLASEAVTMRALLDHMRAAHGGAAHYAEAIGLSPSEVGSVVARLCH